MTTPPMRAPDQFLREDAIRGGMDLMIFAHSRLLRHADERLGELGLGRAHHRVMYFVARRPDMTVGELLAILAVTKQSFARVARQLTDRGLLERRPGESDGRHRLLRLTPAGAALEQSLFAELHDAMANAFASSGGFAVSGYWTVMQALMGDEARAQFRRLHHELVEGEGNLPG